MRAIIHICKDGLRIFSRSAGVDDPTRPLEKTSSLPHLAEMKFPNLAGTILDAEILAPGLDVSSIAGAINSKQHNLTSDIVKAFVFDVLRFIGDDLTSKPLQQRIGILEILKRRYNLPSSNFCPGLSQRATSVISTTTYYFMAVRGQCSNGSMRNISKVEDHSTIGLKPRSQRRSIAL